ncbi:MAG: hypothetical protein LBT26_10460 [Clostridiales Family XIII bacterium]|nr:hypothetical protein [Clostridiales Family XIII bacterium]
MKNSTRDANVAAPEFELSGFFRVTFKRNAVASSGSQAVASGSQAVKVNDKKQALLAYAEEHSQITAPEASAFWGISSGRVRQIFRDMVSDGTIEKIGDNRFTYYVCKK